jgi:hypothetical protein
MDIHRDNCTEVPDDPTFRRLGSGSWVRDHDGEVTSGGHALVVHVARNGDISASHRTYDPTCGWCYLGANHSGDEHARKVERALVTA